MKLLPLAVCLSLLAAPLAFAQTNSTPLSIDTSNSTDWKISNGVLTVDWLPNDGRIFSMHWSAFPNQELIDQTNRSKAGAKGFYMDNAGLGASTPSNQYFVDPNGKYIDWWMTQPSSATNAFTWSQHYVLFANDPGVHIYFVLDHGTGDVAGSIGQIQWVMRGDLSQFTNTYSKNTGLSNLGATTVPLPDAVLFGTTDKGRNVQDATVDLHGLTLPAKFRREFYTKYDYSSYEYLHRAEGVYGQNMAEWMVVPSHESLTGGPSKQDLIFTGNLLIMEAYSNHLNNQMKFSVPPDAPMHRLYGPYYLHFNAFNSTNSTPDSLYREALSASEQLKPAYDAESILVQNGYVPSTDRGDVFVRVNGLRDFDRNHAWAVLSDNQTNVQYSHAGREYWANLGDDGAAIFPHVAPGTYRLTVYQLGQWGELRRDGITVEAHQPTFLSVNLKPEDFAHSQPVWTIGNADRSSHEFLHGQVENPIDLEPNCGRANWGSMSLWFHPDGGANCSVQDDRQFWGNWNYWADFADNQGAVVYYATPVGSVPATNDLTKWNYNHWHVFNPGLFAGIYNPADDTTDGYKYICPAYVGNCATAAVPDWQVHFTTTADQQKKGQYVALSVGLAATESNLAGRIQRRGVPLEYDPLVGA